MVDPDSCNDDFQHLQVQWAATQVALASQAKVPSYELHEFCGSVVNDVVGGGYVHSDFLLPWDVMDRAVSALSMCATTKNETRPHPFLQQLQHDRVAQTAYAASLGASTKLPDLTIVGGIDVSFIPDSNDGVACLAVMAYPSMTLLHCYVKRCTLTTPYVSGFLGMREVEPVAALMDAARSDLDTRGWMPQLLVVDGGGVHHPRRCGFATQLGILLGIPTIGCAKKMLVVDGLTREVVQQLFQHDDSGPSSAVALHPIVGMTSKQLFGYALKTGSSTQRLTFVSPGHRLGFAVSVALALTMAEHRVVEPIRVADLSSRAFIRSMSGTTQGSVSTQMSVV